ncbi:MATE family efflux transporter, partial [Sutterella parvirubra]
MSKSITPPNTSLKALASLAGPIFVANIAIIGSGTIDTIMAGQLGKDHLAAITLGISATICVLMGLVGVLQGLSPIAGHHFGAKRFNLIGEEMIQSFWLGAFLLLIGLPILLSTDIWIGLAEVKGDVADMAATFMFWTAMALPASLGGRIFISVNAAVSRPRITMWVSLGMLALKAPLNAVFMYGWLGFPAMGGGGAGVSFFVLSWLSLCAYALIWKFDGYYKQMHAPKFTGPKWSLLKEHLHVGIPIGLSTFFEV